MADDSTGSPPPPVGDRELIAADLQGGRDDEFFAATTAGSSSQDGTEADGTEIADDVVSIEDSVINEQEPKDNEDKKKSRLNLIYCGCSFIVCIGLMVLLYFLLRREDVGLARAQLDPATNSPTFVLETDSPTPLIPQSTPNPTSNPTPVPTLPPISLSGELSRLPCDEINLAAAEAPGENLGDGNFKVYPSTDGTSICGDTFGGEDPNRPNRNYWSVSIGRRDCPRFSYDDGFAICDTVGARWCTVDEFIAEVAYGTGCGGDREFVYTNTDCFDNDAGVPGKVMFDVGLRDERQPFFFCESDLTRLSLARCCGDMEV